MTPTKRVLNVACVVIVALCLLESAGAGAASNGRVEPRDWARTVCVAALPAAKSMAAETKTWPSPGPRPETAEGLVTEVETADRALGLVARYVRALGTGVREAGVPAVIGGASVVRQLQRATSAYLGTLGLLHTAFARFLVEHELGRERAVGHLREVLDSPEGRLAMSLHLDRANPVLARAVRSVPECLDIADALGHAAAAMNAATRLVRT